MYKYALTNTCTANHHHAFSRLVHLHRTAIFAAFSALLNSVAPSRLRKSFFVAMAKLWVETVCISGMSPSEGGISPMHTMKLTQCELNGDRRITAVVPGYQSIPLQENYSKEKDFGKHCQLYISIELILTEKKLRNHQNPTQQKKKLSLTIQYK